MDDKSMITCEEAHVEEKNIQIHDEIQLETHEIQNLLTDDERLLLDKLVQTDGRNQLYLRSNTDVSISNISSSLNSLNVETPPNSLVGHPPFAHSQAEKSSRVLPRICRNQSADAIMLKSALAKRSANAPRKPLRVSFSDIRDSEEEEEEEQQPPKQLSVNFAPDEVKKLQKELHELRKKLEEIQPAESTPSDVVVDVPPLPDSTPISDIIGIVASKLNLSTDVIKQDFDIMNKARIKDVSHLKMLMSNEQLWKEFELPILEKCALEQLLGKGGLSEGSTGWFWVLGVAAFVPVALTGLLFNNPTTNKLFRFFEDLFEL